MVKCSIKCCSRDPKKDIGVSFFRFPAESARCDEWMKAVGRPDLVGIDTEKFHHSKYRVCGVHFHPNSFSSMLLNRLKKEAIPVKFPLESIPGPFFEGDPEELQKMMPSSESNVENKIHSVNKDQPDDKTGNEHQKESENEVTTNSDEQEEMEKDQQMESEAEKEIDSEKHTEMEKEHVESEIDEQIESEKTENEKEDPLKSNEQVDSEKLKETSGDGISKDTSGDGTNNETENSQRKETENGITESNTQNNDEKMEVDENEEDEDDDFNPLLLCPDISMDVEESPVLTGSTETSQMTDTADSNSLFAPLFSTFVDEMTGAEISFNLTAEEQQLREKLYGPNNPIQFTKIHCTACNVHLGSALAGQTNRFVHPLLKVLICKECYHFYTSGEFEKDEDGSELYCRWCGQGGQVLCCTMCEFVFCKKCIRINFGRKKLTQVRDSDDWKCFRCDMSQLKALRAMCVEFFEYIRRETSRAASYTDTDIVNKDHTNCCQGQNKKRSLESDKETEKEVVKRPKRRRNEEEDPDYNPYVKEDDDVPSSSLPSTSGVKVAANVVKPVTLIHGDAAKIQAEMKFTNQSPPPTVRIGNTVLNVKGLGTLSPVNIPPLVSRNTAIRTPIQQTYIKPKPVFTPRSSHPQTPNPRAAVTPTVHIRTPAKPPIMKHEWFEKTVRAAARVNSNLSYTLTQLNKAQSSASSVEQLAVVHNKLQEILSSSINSLIQIRKNLRTEFIAGIKTIRFPPKQAQDPNDDDVIIVNTETSTTNSTQNNKISMPAPPQNTAKRFMKQKPTVNSSTPTTTNSAPSKGYLKVRSFSQLQSVSSECITIPDDDPPPNQEPIVVEVSEDVLEENSKESATKENNDEEATKETEKNTEEKDTNKARQEKDKDKDVGDKEKVEKEISIETSKEGNNTKDKENNTKDKKSEDECIQNGEKIDKDKTEKEENSKTKDCESNGKEKDSNDSEKCNGNLSDGGVKVKTEPDEHSYNVNDNPTPKIRRMLSVKVNLKKTPVIENLVKQEPVENGDN